MRNIKFTSDCYNDYLEWNNSNPDVFSKINELIKDILREPFKGLGKPEPFRSNWKGYWSRRITKNTGLFIKLKMILFFL